MVLASQLFITTNRPPQVMTFEYYSKQGASLQNMDGNQVQHAKLSQEDNALSWWKSFSQAITGISIFGASITYTVILSDIPDPNDIRIAADRKGKPQFSREKVRKFLALSWLMFVLSLGFAILSQLILRKATGIRKSLKMLELILNGLIIAAFMFLSLGVVAYVPEVGWAGVGGMSFFALVVVMMWMSGNM